MRVQLTTKRLDRIILKLGKYRLAPSQWRSLGKHLEKVITEGNRRGVLVGLDKDGNLMAPVTYRTGKGIQSRLNRGDRPYFATSDQDHLAITNWGTRCTIATLLEAFGAGNEAAWNREDKEIAARVSLRATEPPPEFVAELYAATYLGVVFDDAIMVL